MILCTTEFNILKSSFALYGEDPEFGYYLLSLSPKGGRPQKKQEES